MIDGTGGKAMKLEIKGEFVNNKHVSEILMLISTLIAGDILKGSFTSAYDPEKLAVIEWELKDVQ